MRQPSGEPQLAPQAHDFAPDLLTVQLSPPSRLPRGVLLGLTGIVGGLLAWSFLAELDIVVTAQGRLVPISYTKVVQPAEAGVVGDILVKDGDFVKAGQVLLRLDARLSQTDLQAQGQDVAIKRMTLARIAAELAAADSANPAAPAFAAFTAESGAGTPVLALQMQSQYVARRQAYLDARAQELQSLAKARAEREAGEQVYSKLKRHCRSTPSRLKPTKSCKKKALLSCTKLSYN